MVFIASEQPRGEPAMAAAEAIRISQPKESEKQQTAELYRMLIHDGTAALIAPDNRRINIPSSIYDVLVKVVETLQEGRAIAVVPLKEQLHPSRGGFSRHFAAIPDQGVRARQDPVSLCRIASAFVLRRC